MTAFALGRSRRLPRVLFASLAAVVLATTAAVTPVAAATDQLRVAVSAVYRVDPAERAVHVTMDIKLTNQKADTSTTYFWYDTLTLGIPQEAKSVRATSNGSKLSVTNKARSTFREVTIHYPNLYHGKTRTMRMTFDMPSGKPRSDSPIRVGRAYTAFTAWAWGDPGLGDVRIVLPPQFTGEVATAPNDPDAQLARSSVKGRTEYAVEDIDDPIGWHASIEASDRDALTDVAITPAGEAVVIHAWPEDADWIDRVSAVLEDGLPDLKTAIGLPWPVSGELEVTEVTASELEGYAGFFDSSEDAITISEDLNDFVILHEASHAWFDGSLFQGRWIGEGLADEYAARVLAADHPDDLREEPSPVSANDATAFDLNTWRAPTRIDADSAAYERFGYDASWTVMRAIIDDVTEPKMRDVLQAAAARTLTYVGAGPAESSGFVPDWRRFLDLVTDVGGSTKAEALLETWVLTPKQDAELDARETARTRYFALVAAGRDWQPGVLVRKPMSNWRFTEAESAMGEAESVIAARDTLAAATTDLGLAFPGGLEAAYESADATEDLTTLEARIAEWSAAASAIRAARDELARERAPLVALGLIDTDPGAGYTAALAAFAAGDDKAVLAGSATTVAALAGADEIGRGRATTAGAVVGVVLLLLAVLAIVLVRRRRRRPAAVPAAEGALAGVAPVADVPVGPASQALDTTDVPPPPVGVRRLDTTDVPPPPSDVRRLDAGDPYATLAATPDLVAGTQDGEPGARGAEPD